MTMNRYQAPFGQGGSHAIDEDIAWRLLRVALERGGDYADLFFEYSVSGSYSYDEHILKSVERAVSMGLGVRVIKGNATGYAYCEQLDYDAMKKAAKTAAQIASGQTLVQPVSVSSQSMPVRYPIMDETLDVSGELKKSLLERTARKAWELDPRIVHVDALFSEHVREILVVNSKGSLVRDRQPMIRFGVRVIAEEEGKRQSGNSGGGGRMDLGYFEQKRPEEHAEEAVRQALTMLDAKEAPAGEMEVVLAPGDSGILLHEAVGHGLEADFNRKKTSTYSERIGQVVASELCTVVDDASVQSCRGSINVDDEGNFPSCSTLIQNGVLQGYMQDRASADFFDTAPTGHGRRQSFRSRPMPRMTNTILLGGQDDPEDIIGSVRRGVLARKFGGGQVDISNGDFVFSLTEGYLIEDGKLTAPLKGVNLIGNGPDVMGRVTMLGHDFQRSDGIWTCGKEGQSVPVGVGCPTVKISSMTVGGTQVEG